MNYSTQVSHILIFSDNAGVRSILLKDKTYSLGRDKYNNIVFLTSKVVSRNHAMLFRTTCDRLGHEYQIVDGDSRGKRSTNGVIVNNERCHSHKLSHGDVILLGSVEVLYQSIEFNSQDCNVWQVNSEDILVDPLKSLNPKATLVNSESDPKLLADRIDDQEVEENPPTAFFRKHQ